MGMDLAAARACNRCEAQHSHAEWPLSGQCTSPATKIDADDDTLSCDAHAARNPWRNWKPWGHDCADGTRAVGDEEDCGTCHPAGSQDDGPGLLA